jgi:hypothetical protein
MLRQILLITMICLCTLVASAQKKTALPHGMTYGTKPSTVALLRADTLEQAMGKKARISTSVVGKVLKVTKSKGGWFDMDAGKGRIIKAHFKDYNISLPTALKGREVIIQGVAAKQFIADDAQPLAGDTVVGKKQHQVRTNPKQRLIFEMTGLMVNK